MIDVSVDPTSSSPEERRARRLNDLLVSKARPVVASAVLPSLNPEHPLHVNCGYCGIHWSMEFEGISAGASPGTAAPCPRAWNGALRHGAAPPREGQKGEREYVESVRPPAVTTLSR